MSKESNKYILIYNETLSLSLEMLLLGIQLKVEIIGLTYQWLHIPGCVIRFWSELLIWMSPFTMLNLHLNFRHKFLNHAAHKMNIIMMMTCMETHAVLMVLLEGSALVSLHKGPLFSICDISFGVRLTNYWTNSQVATCLLWYSMALIWSHCNVSKVYFEEYIDVFVQSFSKYSARTVRI